MQDDGAIRGPITSDDPIKPDEIELTEADKKRLEEFPAEERHAELERMNLERLQALEEAHHAPDHTPEVEALYQQMKDALLGVDRKTKQAIAKRARQKQAKKKAKKKAAEASRRKNR